MSLCVDISSISAMLMYSIKWTLTAENSRRLLTRQHDAGLEVETIKHCGGGGGQ